MERNTIQNGPKLKCENEITLSYYLQTKDLTHYRKELK